MPGSSPLQIIDAALTELGEVIVLSEATGPTSHTAVVAEGLDEPRVAVAVGRYLLGVIAGAVQLDGSLSAKYLPTGPADSQDVVESVLSLVGETNAFVSEDQIRFRDRVRNAWIAEGLTHALLVVRARVDTACLPGQVCAISKPHVIPSEPGLDAVALYEFSGDPYLAIGESKATRARGAPELRKAVRFFERLDARKYNQHLRSALIALGPVIPSHLSPKVSNAIWQDAACYVPAIVHGDAFDHLTDRDWLAALGPPVERRRLLLLRIDDFHGFFNRVADTMRNEYGSLVL
jgi:hypothetical protein